MFQKLRLFYVIFCCMKQKLLFFLFLIPFLLLAQEVDRVEVTGIITAPQGEDVEYIQLYNVSAQEGTVTDADGSFTLKMAVNDRILVTALQFQSFTVIIDEGVIAQKRVKIYMNPSVNQLDEVIVRPHDLSGTISVDVKRIATVEVERSFDDSYENLELKSQFLPDRQSTIQGNYALDAYNNGQQQLGGNVLGLVGLAVAALFSKDRKVKVNTEPLAEAKVYERALRDRFPSHYVVATYGIEAEKVEEFLFFVEESGIEPRLFKPENELLLMDYMRGKSIAFKANVEN